MIHCLQNAKLTLRKLDNSLLLSRRNMYLSFMCHSLECHTWNISTQNWITWTFPHMILPSNMYSILCLCTQSIILSCDLTSNTPFLELHSKPCKSSTPREIKFVLMSWINLTCVTVCLISSNVRIFTYPTSVILQGYHLP